MFNKKTKRFFMPLAAVTAIVFIGFVGYLDKSLKGMNTQQSLQKRSIK